MYLYLYPQVIPILAQNNCSIINFNSGESFAAKNNFVQFLIDNRNENDVIELLVDDESSDICQYIINNNLGFISTNKLGINGFKNQLFSVREFNFIVEVSNNFPILYLQMSSIFSRYRVITMDLIWKEETSQTEINDVIKKLTNDIISSIRILVDDHTTNWAEGEWNKVLLENAQIERVILFNSKNMTTIIEALAITKTNNSLNQLFNSGTISKANHYYSFKNYKLSKSKNVNFCSNLFIDNNGNVKFNINHSLILGNIIKSNFIDIITSDQYTSHVNATVDNIEECKYCDKRSICLNSSELVFGNNTIERKAPCSYFK